MGLQKKYFEMLKNVLCHITNNSYHLSSGISDVFFFMPVKLLILQTILRIDFCFINQIIKLLNQTYPWNYLSENCYCGELMQH